MTETKSLAPAENKAVEAKPKAALAVGVVPSAMEEVYRIAQFISRSDLAPKDYRGKLDNCVAAIMMGADIGLKPMQAVRFIANINGRPVVWGDAIPAIIMNHKEFGGMRETFEPPNAPVEKTTAICKILRKGVGEVERSFSWDDAIRAGLAKKEGPWQTYPRRMLQMRARGFAARDAFPDALLGLALAEEVGDSAPPKIINPSGEQFDPAEELESREDVAALPAPEQAAEPVAEEPAPPVVEGFTEKEMTDFDLTMAGWVNGAGSKQDRINGLMEWVKKQWNGWNAKGTPEQVKELIKSRDAILKEIRAST